MYLSEEIQKKWSPVLDHPDLQEISDPYRKSVTAVILENQEKALQEEKQVFSEAVHANNMSNAIDTYDPILISLVRALPNLMAYDVCGVQPMTSPTGLIFAMKSHYTSQTGTEKLFITKQTPTLLVLEPTLVLTLLMEHTQQEQVSLVTTLSCWVTPLLLTRWHSQLRRPRLLLSLVR